jgi:hypothetical protein
MSEETFCDFHVIDGRTAYELIYGDIEGCIDAVSRAYTAHSEGHRLP